MKNIDPDTAQDFLIWLSSHESDIQNEVNDFGDLKDLFCQLFSRYPGYREDGCALW